MEPPLLESGHHLAAVGRENSGAAHHRLEDRGRRAEEFEGHDVPDREHPSEQVLGLVVNLHLGGAGADLGISERGDQVPEALAGDHAVRVHGHQDLAAGALEAGRQGVALAAVPGVSDRLDQSRVPRRRLLNVIPRVVGGAVIHADHFHQLPRIVRESAGVDGLFHHRSLVVSGNDDADGRKRPLQGIGFVKKTENGPIREVEEDQAAVDEQRKRQESGDEIDVVPVVGPFERAADESREDDETEGKKDDGLGEFFNAFDAFQDLLGGKGPLLTRNSIQHRDRSQGRSGEGQTPGGRWRTSDVAFGKGRRRAHATRKRKFVTRFLDRVSFPRPGDDDGFQAPERV